MWCTGYRPQHDWIDLPVLDADCELVTDHRGAVASEPGLYRVGREFLYAFNSHTVGGVGRDAKRIVEEIARSADLNPAGRRLLLERGAVQGRRRAAPLAS